MEIPSEILFSVAGRRGVSVAGMSIGVELSVCTLLMWLLVVADVLL